MKHDETPSGTDPHDDPGGVPGPASDGANHAPRPATPDPLEQRPARMATFDGAWAELVRVHEVEQARLLREACLLRRSSDKGAFAVPRSGTLPDAELGLALWRRRAVESIELALIDGLEPPASLRFCAAHRVERWPESTALARASLALENCASGRRLVRG